MSYKKLYMSKKYLRVKKNYISQHRTILMVLRLAVEVDSNRSRHQNWTTVWMSVAQCCKIFTCQKIRAVVRYL